MKKREVGRIRMVKDSIVVGRSQKVPLPVLLFSEISLGWADR